MKRKFIILLALILSYAIAWAAPTFTVNAPRQVLQGNKFSVTFRLSDADEGTGLKAPQINGCTLLYGPSVSTMQSYQVINGHASSSQSVDYTFTYRADNTGTVTIGSASINVGGKTLKSSPTTFSIVANGGGNGTTPPRPDRNKPVDFDDVMTQTDDRTVSGNDVFVRIILSKTQAYEQEAIECTIKLYTKYNISSFLATQQPTFDGFLADEMSFTPQMNDKENYNGQEYATAILKKCILFPQKSGKLNINSGRYDLNVVQYRTHQVGIFTSATPVERKLQVNSNSASVNVIPLPEPKPAGFTGAVGQFSIDSKISGTSLKTGEAATLTYTISGVGNVKYAKEPVIDFPSEFEQYTPTTKIDTDITGNTVKGSMTIEYTFTPQAVGDFTIGEDRFVYFNPSTKEYVTLTTPAYHVKVAKGSGKTSSSASQSDIKTKNTDIRHIKLGDKHQSFSHTLVVTTWWYWMIWALLIAGLVGAIVITGRINRLNADITGRRIAKANKVARKRLRIASQLMAQHKTDEFYEEVLRATWGYLSDKLSIPTSQLNRENVAQELTNYGASEQLTKEFIDILDECEMARYTPQHSEQQLEALYDKASNAMNSMASIKPTKQ